MSQGTTKLDNDLKSLINSKFNKLFFDFGEISIKKLCFKKYFVLRQHKTLKIKFESVVVRLFETLKFHNFRVFWLIQICETKSFSDAIIIKKFSKLFFCYKNSLFHALLHNFQNSDNIVVYNADCEM